MPRLSYRFVQKFALSSGCGEGLTTESSSEKIGIFVVGDRLEIFCRPILLLQTLLVDVVR